MKYDYDHGSGMSKRQRRYFERYPDKLPKTLPYIEHLDRCLDAVCRAIRILRAGPGSVQDGGVHQGIESVKELRPRTRNFLIGIGMMRVSDLIGIEEKFLRK
jgi:hypothetical protein